MARKKKSKASKVADSKKLEDQEIMPDGYIGQLTAAQYWEWRCAIAERNLAKQRLESARILHTLKSIEAAKASLEAENFGLVKVPKANRELENYEREFNDTQKSLEDALGESMKGAIIDEAFRVIRSGDASHGSA